MRCLDRDRKRVRIARFVKTEPVTDANGRLTGRNKAIRTDPSAFFPTLSAVRGEATGDYFGQKVDYDRTLTVDDPDFEVAEADVIWIEKDPDNDEPHDYVVTKVARQGSYTVIAVKRVDVSK